MRLLPLGAAGRLGQAVLQAVDRALVLDALEQAFCEALAGLGQQVQHLLQRRVHQLAEGLQLQLRPDDLVAEMAALAAMSAPVDRDVSRALLAVVTACLPARLAALDTTALSAATTAIAIGRLPKVG